MNINEMAAVLRDVRFGRYIFKLYDDGKLPRLQLICLDDDARTNEPTQWSSRKWLLSYHMTRSEIVQTALKAVLTAVEHEARERFLYRGQPIFGPHYNVDRLVDICAAGAVDVRVDNRSAEIGG